MSDVNTKNEGATVSTPKKKNPYTEAVILNCETFMNDNQNGTACYLGGTEKDGKIVIQTKEPIRNAINGNVIKGTNQLILQNAMQNDRFGSREVLTYEQAKAAGVFVKKGSSINITIPNVKNPETGKWEGLIGEYPTSACFTKDEKGNYGNGKGELALAKLNSQRFGKINKDRARIYNEKDMTPEKKDKLMKSIAFEHKKQLDYISVTGTQEEVNNYLNKSVTPEEKKILTEITVNSPTPSLSDQKGRAVNELKREKEFLDSKKQEAPVIDATQTTNPVHYVAKYLAACELNAEFVTDKESQAQVQKQISANCQKNFESNNFDSFFTFGAECSERCKGVLKEFRGKTYEQQRGIQNERPITQERPDHTVDAITF